jgi:hypothetical protein
MLSFYSVKALDFKDNFNNVASSGWKCYGGLWTVNKKQYHSNSCYGFALVEKFTYENFNFKGQLIFNTNGSAGIIFNVSEPDNGRDSLNGYYLSLNSFTSNISLHKICRGSINLDLIKKENIVDGNREELISLPYPISKNTAYQFKVTKKGDFIDVYLNNNHLISIADKSFKDGHVGLKSDSCSINFDNIEVFHEPAPTIKSFNWSWVKGVIYVPTHCVNQVQQWEEFNEEVNDRELSYAHAYGLNLVRVYLHYLVWEKDKNKFLKDVETFLHLADKHHLKTEFVFFDDIWDKYPHLGPQKPPLTSVHNSRWMQCPGDSIKDRYDAYKNKLKAYVQDVVRTHKHDSRIAFWEPYNEPGFSQSGKYLQISKRLLNDSRVWIKQTNTSIPISSTSEPGFMGESFSDFFSWHSYDPMYGGPRGDQVLNTECMNRKDQSVNGIVENYGKKGTGYIIWELGIGRDNSRFPWDTPANAPEVEKPFHGLIYPDGHPWDTNEVAAIRGNLFNMNVFEVSYFIGNFETLKKVSIAPRIDFDIGDERGTGSPDASAGIGEDSFSISWNGKLNIIKSGYYIFYIHSDYIASISINDNLLFEKLVGDNSINKKVFLRSDKINKIKVNYFHNKGNSSMHVYWSGPGFRRKILESGVR